MPWCRLCSDFPTGKNELSWGLNRPPVPRVLSFGEVLWDLLPSGPVLGGAPFNLAFRLNSLGAPTRMASRVGRDRLGQEALERASTLGLDTRLIQTDTERPTGTVEISLGPGGEPDFTILPAVAYDFIEYTPELERAARDCGCICFGSLIRRGPESRATLARLLDSAPDALRVLDINLRRDCYSAETVAGSLECADFLKLNETEVEAVARLLGWPALSPVEFCARAVREYSLRACIVTLGGAGALAHSAESGTVYSPGWRVEVLDTVGSGDAFTAGFLHAFFQGRSLGESCARGNLLGALNSAREGATATITEQEIRTLENSRTERIVQAEYKSCL